MPPLAAAVPKEQYSPAGTGVNAVLLGPPGCGKGTQVYISLLRKNASNDILLLLTYLHRLLNWYRNSLYVIYPPVICYEVKSPLVHVWGWI